MKHIQQVFTAAGHLPLHGQAEIFFHSFGDSTGHCVMSEKKKRGKKMTLQYNLLNVYYEMMQNRNWALHNKGKHILHH